MDRKRVAASRLFPGRTPLTARALWLVLSLVLGLPGVVQAAGGLPDGVPDVRDPRILASWEPYLVGNLNSDPDFPVVVYLNKSGSGPAAVMVAIDARNGMTTWSPASDPVIAIAVFADSQTLARLYYDRGFAEDGRPSGQHGEIARPDSAALSALLRWTAHLQRRVYM